MAVNYPTPATGQPVKMVFLSNYKQWGWSNVLYYSAVGTSASEQWTDIVAACSDAAASIDATQATDCDVVGARCALLNPTDPLLKTANQSRLFSRADLVIPDIAGQGPPESPWSAILWNLSTGDFTLDRRWLLRGCPAVAQQRQTAQGGFDPGNNAFVQAFQSRLQRRIFSAAANAGTPARAWSGQFCQKARVMNPSLAPFAAIQEVSSSANPGFLRYRILEVDDWGVDVGDQILIQGTRLELGKGASGIATVTGITDVAGPPATKLLLTDRKWSSYGPPQVKTYGQARKLVFGLFGLRQITFERFVKRDTGRPFFGTRGRR